MKTQSWPDERLDEELTRLYAGREAPESFRAGWRAAVCREETQRMQKKEPSARVWTRVVLPAAACLALVVGTVLTGNMDLTGTRGNAPSAQTDQADQAEWSSWDFGADSASMKSETSRSYSAAGNTVSGAGGVADTALDERKIVRTADVALSTGDFEADQARIEALVTQAGGTVQYQSTDAGAEQKRSASYTLRVPAAALDQFLDELSAIGRMQSRTESADDYSTQYYDAQTRLDTQRQKLTRLQELLAKAEQVSDILEIESAIADAQYQIDNYQSTVSRVQKQVDESTVNVTLTETGAAEASQAADVPLGARVSQGFSASLKAIGRFFQNMLVFLVMAAPVLVPVAIAVVVIVLIVKRRSRKEGSK